MNPVRSLVLASIAAASVCDLPGASASRLADSPPDSAITAVLAAFRAHAIVILGLDHRQLSELEFAQALITTPEFATTANDVVVECANARYQGVLDRYIAGEDIPFDQLAVVWRNATQVGRCDGPEGPELLAAIRRRNRELPPSRRIRVLAPDPRIDWDAVRSATDVAPFLTARDTSIVGTVKREVLARGRKALLLIGAGHVVRRPMTFGDTGARVLTVTQQFERDRPGATWVIIPHQGFGPRTGEYEARMREWHRPSLVDLARSWPGEEPAGLVYTGAVMRVGQDPSKPRDPYPGSRLRDLADAFLYLGPMDSLHYVRPPSYALRDSAYLRELDRRRLLTGEGTPAPLPARPPRGAAGAGRRP